MEENNKIILEKAKGEIEQSMKKQKKQLHINIFAIVIICIVFCLIMFLCLFNKFSHTDFRIIDIIDIIDSIKIYALILIIGILVIAKPMLKEIKNLKSMHNNIEKNVIKLRNVLIDLKNRKEVYGKVDLTYNDYILYSPYYN